MIEFINVEKYSDRKEHLCALQVLGTSNLFYVVIIRPHQILSCGISVSEVQLLLIFNAYLKFWQGKMALQFIALADLSEDTGFISSINIVSSYLLQL